MDENDNVIGTELKSVCHSKGILHRGVAAFVFKDESFIEVLLQKRSKKASPGLLCPPSGHVGSGESYFESYKKRVSGRTISG